MRKKMHKAALARSSVVKKGNRSRQPSLPNNARITGMQDPSLINGAAEQLGVERQSQMEITDIAHARKAHFFVPNIAVVRPVFVTDEVREFHRGVSEQLDPRRYRVFDANRYALQIMSKASYVRGFIDADVQPRVSDIRQVAESIQGSLKPLLKSKPRRITMYTRGVYPQGDLSSVFGVEPAGWRGHTVNYPTKIDGKPNVNAQLSLERTASIGTTMLAMRNGQTGNGSETTLEFHEMRESSPYVPIAIRRGGHPISDAERVEHTEAINELLPETFDVYDPVILYEHMPLTQIMHESGLQGLASGIIFARRTKTKDFPDIAGFINHHESAT